MTIFTSYNGLNGHILQVTGGLMTIFTSYKWLNYHFYKLQVVEWSFLQVTVTKQLQNLELYYNILFFKGENLPFQMPIL